MVNPAGEGDGTGCSRTPDGSGVDVPGPGGQDLGAKEGSRKRKAAAMSKDSNNLLGCTDSELGCEDSHSQKISLQIENLRSQLDEYQKQLGYRKEIEKLRLEMDIKDKEVQCLKKQNEELQVKYEGLEIKYKKKNKDLQAMCDKWNMEQELRTMYKKQNEEVQYNYEKQNEALETNYEKQNEDLQSKYKKQKEELQSKYEKQKKELQATFEEQKKDMQSYYKMQKEELQTLDILEKQIDAKRRQIRQLEELYSIMEFPLPQLKDGKRIPEMSCDKDSNVVDGSAEKSGVDEKADDEKLRLCLDLEVAKLDAEILIKLEKLGEMLEQEKFSSELGSAALWKSIQTNMELHDIQKTLIWGFDELQGNSMRKHGVGVKRMGEINFLALREALHQKHGQDEELENKAIVLTSVWENELKNPSWHPFKIVEADGRFQEVLDDDDEKIKALRIEHGDVVCNIVKTAVMEINEYNPSGRFPVRELWNFNEGRKVMMQEVLGYLFRKLRSRRRAAIHGLED